MPSLTDWNWYVLMLVQALLGVISNNFRVVTLRFAGDHWVVEAWLLEENQQDSDEFFDAVDEFSIFIEDVKQQLSSCSYHRIVGEIRTGAERFANNVPDDARVVFKRRET